ncbi:MAG: hypothetical protein WAM82_19325 [Thermoanaerobaculia bacterium]
MNRKNIFAGAALLGGLLIASQAHAFAFFTCNGNPMTWGDPFAMVQNKFSIPTGSQAEVSLDNAINRWRGIVGMFDMVSKSPFITNGNTITNGDGQNDTALTNRANIGGNNGLTLMIHNLCVLSSSWIEADVLVANDLGFGHVDEALLTGTSGRSTFMHEFGHAHGLAHSQNFNNMRTPQPRPVVGGANETVDAMPDDAQAGRFLYPTGNSQVNLFATAFRQTAGNQIVLNNTGTIVVCAKGGNMITLTSTVGNNGTVNVTQTERWWISSNSQAHNGGTTIGQWNGSTFNANGVLTRQVTFKLPALPVGTFFVFHGVDVLGQVNESREDDNAVREGVLLQVNNC